MKMILAILMLSIAMPSFANIIGSELSSRHQAVIAKAVAEKCFLTRGLTEVKTEVRVDRVDQGVIDYYYTSELTAVDYIDQGVFDTYKVIVESAIFSGYDHEAQDWGLIDVQSVKCTML
ncbi:MAG: hypothetical protein ACLGG0_10460 [Bacteriovoracia bacterium]